MEFDTEQKKILEEIFAEAYAKGHKAATVQSSAPENGVSVYGTPLADLCKEEVWKYEEHGLDIWDKLMRHAGGNEFPQGGDIFRFKFHGLFYVAPAQNSFMLRLRIPGCRLTSVQAEAIAEISERWGPGAVDITTRGNIQIREIQPKDIISVLTRLYDAGLTSKGSGADNIRNITASPTSGFDANELIDVLPHALSLHHYILNNRELYGLPRKFNVSFDNGGAVSVAVDTNDIGFIPLRIEDDTQIADGIYFRVLLAGITGHQRFARDAGILVKADEAVTLAVAMIRVFIAHGDRTNRKRARLVYLIEKWGVQKFLDETQKLLSFPLLYASAENYPANTHKVPHGHVGIYRSAGQLLNYAGIAVPVGRLSAKQLRGIAQLSNKYGRGDLRLTVWQNIIVPHIADKDVTKFSREVAALSLSCSGTAVSGGIVACTGNTGCKYAGANTKDTAITTAAYLDKRIELDRPVNIHFTGCAHSCAQHYIGDIGLMGVPITGGEGFNIALGGGLDATQAIGNEVFWKVPREEIPQKLEKILTVYKEKRNDGETFAAFTRRHDVKTLQELFS